MRNKDNPCYMCERRWATNKDSCHSTCKEHKDFSKAKAEEAAMIRKKKDEEAAVVGALVRSAEKAIREKRRR